MTCNTGVQKKMRDDIVLTMQARSAARAAGDEAEVRRIEEQEKVQWRKWEVIEEIEGAMARQEAAMAVGDLAEVRRLEEQEKALRVRLDELKAQDPTDPHTRGLAQVEAMTAFGALVRRQDAARDAGDDAEVRRLEKLILPLLARSNEINAVATRRHACRDRAEFRRLEEEEKALWEGLVECRRANPFDPHTI